MTDYEIPAMWEDTDLTWKIKEAIARLRPVERTIFLQYVELGTYTALAKKYKVTAPTVRTYIKMIRAKILEYVGEFVAD